MTTYSEDFYRRMTGFTARTVVPYVVELTGRPGSVLDLGCGVGTWLSAFRASGVEDVLGVDGSWVPRDLLAIPEERFVAHDLKTPFDAGRSFDLAVSMEVIEHLPDAAGRDLVVSLTRHAPIVLFSAAIPFQGGTGHVNEKWPEYWAQLFAGQGFKVIDAVRRRIWTTPGVSWFIAQNTFLYAREDVLSERPALAQAAADTDPRFLSVVHPRQFLTVADPREMSLRRAVSALPRVLRHTAERKLHGRPQEEG